jgi:predicted O-linked N-acetylglucosamine transferase (SPINDLY family)
MAEMTVQQAIDLALQHQTAGETAEAEAVYRRMENAVADNAAALTGLGVFAAQAGLKTTALRLFNKAVELEPTQAEAHNGIGAILRSDRRLHESLEALQHAVANAPENPEYLYNLATALVALDRGPEAIGLLKQVILKAPNFVAAHYEMGRALERGGNASEAIESYKRALAFEPGFVPAWRHIGMAMASQRRFPEAINFLRRAAERAPDDVRVQMSLAQTFEAAQQLQSAFDAFMKVVQLQPDNLEAHCGLATVLGDAQMTDQSIQQFQRALAIHPNHLPALFGLARALVRLGRADEAIPMYRQVIALKPAQSDIHSNLLYAMQLSDSVTPEQLLAEHTRWAEQFASPLANRIPAHANDRSPDRGLRIGYVSPDLHNHPVGAFMLPILMCHDRRQFHITCYSNSWTEDLTTARLRAASQAWHVTADWTNERLAEQIMNDRIDILVDLAQHTNGNRVLLFAQKPAPVQVTYLGYPGTTGLKTFDARLGDPYIDPPGQTERFYSEPIARLAESYWCFTPVAEAPAVNPLQASTRMPVTFGCLNKLAKSSPSALRLWASILRVVPGSRLLLNAPEGSCRKRVGEIFNNADVDPARIEFVAKQPFADYLATFKRIDIGLDPFPHNGGTTTCQALWMGVPVVTLAGAAGVQRSGVSLLTSAGLPELIATSPEQYRQIAVGLARDLPRLAELRANLRTRMAASPLMNTPRFVKNLEGVFRSLWRNWCNRT